MCGIAGILDKSGERNLEKEMKKMTEMLSHRGPDGFGFYFDNEIALGHRRLSIIDLSSSGKQPMESKDKKIKIVYNGEIYNYIEIKEELKKKGYDFFSETDTEVIINSYKEWGVKCLEKFNGMWSFAIWDEDKKELFCSRDRFGEKPFYYHYEKDLFVFSSEIKPLLLFKKNRPNEKLIYDFLKFGLLDHTNETFFSEIKKLPPATFMKVSKEKELIIEKYWDFNVSSNIFSNKEDENKNKKDFLNLFKDSVRIRLRSDVPVGSCLSGGLDSSSVVCVANDLLREEKGEDFKQKTFSSCFEDLKFDEREYIEEVVKKTGVSKNYIFPNPQNFLENMDKLISCQEEPFAGAGIYAHNKVIEVAKEEIKVLLDGQGGDELLLGYRKFYFFYIRKLFENGHYFSFFKELILFFSSAQILKTISVKSGLRYFKFGRKFQNIDNLLDLSFNKKFLGREINFGYQKDIGNRIKEDITKYSIPILLRYGDKNSMMHGVEARLPFLDYRLVEKISSMSIEEKIKNGWTKVVLRKSMKGILPEKIRKRKSKLGFSTPEKEWLKKEMKEEVKNTLTNSKFINNYVNKENLLKELNNFFNKKRLLSEDVIFRFYILEKWGRKFILEK